MAGGDAAQARHPQWQVRARMLWCTFGSGVTMAPSGWMGWVLGPLRFWKSIQPSCSQPVSLCWPHWAWAVVKLFLLQEHLWARPVLAESSICPNPHPICVSWGIWRQWLHHPWWEMGWGPPVASFQCWSTWASGLAACGCCWPTGWVASQKGDHRAVSLCVTTDRPLPARGPWPSRLRCCLPPGPPRPCSAPSTAAQAWGSSRPASLLWVCGQMGGEKMYLMNLPWSPPSAGQDRGTAWHATWHPWVQGGQGKSPPRPLLS